MGNFLREVGLDGKDIGQITVVIFRPDMFVVLGVDQLHIHPHAISLAPHAAFENRAHPEFLPDLAHAFLFAAISHDRGARDHLQVADLREVRQNVILDAIGEIGVLRFAAKVFKRQNRDRLFHPA